MVEEKVGIPAILVPRTPKQRAKEAIRTDREAGTHDPEVVGETMKRPPPPKRGRTREDELYGRG